MRFMSDNRNELEVSFKRNISRRALLAGGTAVVASSLLEGQMAKAQSTGGDDGLKVYDVTTNGITLHVTEQGGASRSFLPRVSGYLLYLAPTDESHRVSRISSNSS